MDENQRALQSIPLSRYSTSGLLNDNLSAQADNRKSSKYPEMFLCNLSIKQHLCENSLISFTFITTLFFFHPTLLLISCHSVRLDIYYIFHIFSTNTEHRAKSLTGMLKSDNFLIMPSFEFLLIF